jgi:hypothetical protein
MRQSGTGRIESRLTELPRRTGISRKNRESMGKEKYFWIKKGMLERMDDKGFESLGRFWRY